MQRKKTHFVTKEPTVPRSDPPLFKEGSLVCFAKDNVNKGWSLRGTVGSLDPLLEKQSESDKEEGFQGNLGSLVGYVLKKGLHRRTQSFVFCFFLFRFFVFCCCFLFLFLPWIHKPNFVERRDSKGT